MIQYEIIEDPGLETENLLLLQLQSLALGGGIVFHIFFFIDIGDFGNEIETRARRTGRGSRAYTRRENEKLDLRNL